MDTDSVHNDSHSFVWGNGEYTSAKYYKFIFAGVPQNTTLQSIWKSKALPKLKVFDWLLLLDRLNTKDLMLRKCWHLEDGSDCVLCDQTTLETRDHLFFDCTFARRCWEAIGLSWNTNIAIFPRMEHARHLFDGPCFLEVFSCVTWNIWKVRNDLIFREIQPSFGRWKTTFQGDLILHQYRVRESMVTDRKSVV